MGRQTTRKIQKSANSAHILAKRDSTGTVQTTSQSASNTGVGTATASTTLKLQDPDSVLFTTATVSLTGVTTTTATVTLLRNGQSLTSTSPTGATAATVSTSATHTTPLQAPTYTAQGKVASGTADLNISVSREEQVV